MTVSSTTVKNSYSGNGSTTQFAYGYKIFADSDLIVIIRTDSTGAETVKTLTTHYTVSNAGNASGGNVTFTSGNIPSNTETVILRGQVAIENEECKLSAGHGQFIPRGKTSKTVI